MKTDSKVRTFTIDTVNGAANGDNNIQNHFDKCATGDRVTYVDGPSRKKKSDTEEVVSSYWKKNIPMTIAVNICYAFLQLMDPKLYECGETETVDQVL